MTGDAAVEVEMDGVGCELPLKLDTRLARLLGMFGLLAKESVPRLPD